MYKQFIIGFKKAGGKKYRIHIMAESGTQAVHIASNRLLDKLGLGDFYIIGEAEE